MLKNFYKMITKDDFGAIKELKNEVTVYYKSLKRKGVNYNVCKDVIAKKYGFKNWCDLLTSVSSFELISINYKLKSNDINDFIKNNRSFLKIGKEKNKKIYDKIGNFRNNTLILDDTVLSYDVYMACQLITKDIPIYFLNSSGSNSSLDSLVDCAKACGREKDIKIINLNVNSIYPEYEYKINDRVNQNLDYYLFKALPDHLMPLLKEINFFLKSYFYYSNNKNIQLIDLKNFMEKNDFLQWFSDETTPIPIKNKWNLLLKKNNSEQLNDIKVIRDVYISCIDTLIDSNVFSNTEKNINFDNLLESNNIIIINCNNKDNNLNTMMEHFFINLIKEFVYNSLNAPTVGEFMSDLGKSKTNNLNKKYFIFLKECGVQSYFNFSICRAFRYPLVLSYRNKKQLEELNNFSDHIYGNTCNKVINIQNEENLNFMKEIDYINFNDKHKTYKDNILFINGKNIFNLSID